MHLASTFTVENLSQCHLTWGHFDFDDIYLHFCHCEVGTPKHGISAISPLFP